jgi:hypothetical protein
MAVREDGLEVPRALSAAHADTTFVATLPDRQLLASEHSLSS